MDAMWGILDDDRYMKKAARFVRGYYIQGSKHESRAAELVIVCCLYEAQREPALFCSRMEGSCILEMIRMETSIDLTPLSGP